jgi:hypothetical protein
LAKSSYGWSSPWLHQKIEKKKKKNPKPQTVVFFRMAVQKQAGKLK